MTNIMIENLLAGMNLELANKFVVLEQSIVIELLDGTKAKIEIINC